MCFQSQNNELLKLILNSNVKCLSTCNHYIEQGASGIEPPTSRSAVECSTTELHSHMPSAMKIYLVSRTISKYTIYTKNTKVGHKIQRNTTKKHDSCALAVQNNELLKLILNSNVKCLSTSNHYNEELNHRPFDLQSNALPLSYTPTCPPERRYTWF